MLFDHENAPEFSNDPFATRGCWILNRDEFSNFDSHQNLRVPFEPVASSNYLKNCNYLTSPKSASHQSKTHHTNVANQLICINPFELTPVGVVKPIVSRKPITPTKDLMPEKRCKKKAKKRSIPRDAWAELLADTGNVINEDVTTSQREVIGTGKVVVVRRRVSANKKERRRTQSINSAFSDLRDRIPNVPSDTKLSKIKTLRLATSYIAYLIDILAQDNSSNISENSGKLQGTADDIFRLQFKADLSNRRLNKEERKRKDEELKLMIQLELNSQFKVSSTTSTKHKTKNMEANSRQRAKTRTGWPQQVWTSELTKLQN